MNKNSEISNLIKELSRKHGLNDFIKSIESDLLETKVSIALLGEFSSGKSTLTNVFLGKKILPSLEKPTSSAIVEVEASDNLRAIVKKGNEFEEIELSELGEYIMGEKSKNIDKVIIEAFENDFIKKGIKIIDTPGISSINDIHEEITFGYLPFVDACLIILNANQGGATKSLISFLKNKIIYENDLDKMIFVINFSDVHSKESLESILINTKTQLQEVIKEPIIVVVSALEALNGNIEKSNINELKDIISNNVIAVKDKLLESRFQKLYKEKASQLCFLLSEKSNALKIDGSDVEKQIEKIKFDIISLDDDKLKIKNSFIEFKNNINSYLISVAENYSHKLLDSAINSKTEELNEYCQNLSEEIKIYLEKQFSVLNKDITIRVDDLSDNLKNKVEESVSYIREKIDQVSPIITGVIISALTGPAGITGLEVASQSMVVGLGKNLKSLVMPKQNNFFKEAIRETVPMVSSLIKEIDVPNKILKFGAKSFMQDDIKRKIENALISSTNIFIDTIEKELSLSIEEKVIKPQKQLEQLLSDVRNSRQEKLDQTIKSKEEIENDIKLLKEIL